MVGFFGILLGMFAIGVMQLVLATALPHIVTEIGGNNLYSWVFSSYMLASLITIPIFSKLADIFGKKKFYLLGLGIFAIGTIYGGFAPTMRQLIIARVIQGLGAGIITPVSLAMVSEIFPADRRGRMIGIFGFVQLLSNLLSPSLGSLITTQLGWHWIFFATVIMVILSMVLVQVGIKVFPVTSQIRLPDIDIIGAILFGGFCVLIVGFSKLISKYGSANIPGILLLLCAVIAALMLILHEKKHSNPIIKTEFFKTAIIRRSVLSAVISGAIMYGLIIVLPLCGIVIGKYGYEINESSTLFRFMIGITLGMLVSSRLTLKLNSSRVIRALWASMCLCSIFLLYFLSVRNIAILNAFIVLIGFCTGGIMATFLINSQNAVNSEDRTVLSGLVQLGRYLGASIGVSILTSMLPEITFVSSIPQLLGAFRLLVAFSLIGLVVEFL